VPLVSFLVGFSMLAAGVTSAAGLSLAFAGDYLGTFVDLPAVPTAIAFLALVACLNARGISESLKGNVVMTVIEVSGLVVVIAVVAMMLGGGRGDVSRIGEFPVDANPAIATLGAAIIAYYSFVGFETSANVAEEVRDPSRVYPRALFASLATAGVVYVLVGLASSIALPAEELSDSTGPLLAVVSASGVGVPEWIFSLIALVAVANGALLTMIMASRVTYGMADQGLLPRHPRHDRGRDDPHHGGRHQHPRRDGRAAAALRLHQHQRRRPRAAPRPGRALALQGLDRRARAGHRLLRAAAHPAERSGVAVRRGAAGRRDRAVLRGACRVASRGPCPRGREPRLTRRGSAGPRTRPAPTSCEQDHPDPDGGGTAGVVSGHGITANGHRGPRQRRHHA
jgi:hypothetical protein